MNTDIIIIGAGIAGLTVARALAEKGNSVIILEARDRVGGRIHTLQGDGFSKPVEEGPEFVHGAAPLVRALAKESGVPLFRTESNSYEIYGGQLIKSELVDTDMEQLNQELKTLKTDMTMSVFLKKYFPGDEFASFRENVTNRIAGFDLADVNKISALSLKDEWSDDEEFSGHKPMGGYSQLVNHINKKALEAGATIILSSPVNEIVWQKEKVEVKVGAAIYSSRRLIITIPPSVLSLNSVRFQPVLPEYFEALNKIETGSVVKFLFEFKERYWESAGTGFRTMKDLGFLFSDADVPTWWTQLPSDYPMLTGWFGGPITKNHRNEKELMTMAIDSLSYIFDCPKDHLLSGIKTSKVIAWLNDPYSHGAYSYRTLQTDEALSVLNSPIEDTIFFAGEAYNSGKEMGTVEAALQSAKTVIGLMR